MKIVSIAAAALVLATPVFANQNAKNVRVFDHTKSVTTNVPVTTTECYNVDVPIYGRSQNSANAGDVLGGMILGGLLGKGASGDDKGAAAGAVIGGMIAADKGNKQQIVGYRQERQCTDKVTYRTQTQQVYSHSTVRFTVDGYRYVLEFNRSDR